MGSPRASGDEGCRAASNGGMAGGTFGGSPVGSPAGVPDGSPAGSGGAGSDPAEMGELQKLKALKSQYRVQAMIAIDCH